MRIWKRAAWRKKLLKSSSEFSAIQEDSLLRLEILFCLCDCGAGVSPLQRRLKGMKTNEVCDRPLETFGAATFGVFHTLLVRSYRRRG